MHDNQLHIFAVQSYGYIDGPEDHGPGAEGSRARIDEALRIAQSLPRTYEILFLFPQGYGKENPSVPGDRAVSLGESMASYACSRRRAQDSHIRVSFKAMSWGTLNDIKALAGMFLKLRDDRLPYVHFVTDPVHLKRVRLVWEYVQPWGWKASFYAAKKHRMTWRERLLLEPLKRLLYRYHLFHGLA